MPRGEHKAVHLKPHKYKPVGEKSLSLKPITVRLPPELDEYVRSKVNKSQWMTKAVQTLISLEQQGQQLEIPPNPFVGQ